MQKESGDEHRQEAGVTTEHYRSAQPKPAVKFQVGVAENEYFKVSFEREKWVHLYRCFSTF